MTPFLRLRRALTRNGCRGTCFKLYVEFIDRWFDFRYGLDTCGSERLEDLTVDSANQSRGTQYEPARSLLLRRFFGEVRRLVPSESVLVDLGCGKGRVLLIAAQSGFVEVKGVEFAHELCEIARRNCSTFKQTTGIPADFKIIESDVLDYRIEARDNVFFMFNPFDDLVLAKVLANIESSIKEFPRSVYLCYYNPAFPGSAEDHTAFSKIIDVTHWGYRFKVYSNRGQASHPGSPDFAE